MKKVFKEKDPNFFDSYEEKRQIGENDSYICTIIRKDLIAEFNQYMTRTNTSYQKKVTPSIFETNSYLLENEPNLIEYAAFFGSLKIIQFMNSKGVEFEPKLTNYAIHSNNAKLLHTLEELYLDFCNESCLIESIKCHHNNFAKYIENNNAQLSYNDQIVDAAFHYYNYMYFPEHFEQKCLFFNFYHYKYHKIVDLYIEMKKNEIEKIIILKIKC